MSFTCLAKREISRSLLPTLSAILRMHRTGQLACAREQEIVDQLEREMLVTVISMLLFTTLRRVPRIRNKGFRKPAKVSLLGLLAAIKCVGVSPHSWPDIH